jgi:hypothetical protein
MVTRAWWGAARLRALCLVSIMRSAGQYCRSAIAGCSTRKRRSDGGRERLLSNELGRCSARAVPTQVALGQEPSLLRSRLAKVSKYAELFARQYIGCASARPRSPGRPFASAGAVALLQACLAGQQGEWARK